MWYNDILLMLMGFVVLLMIVMAIMVLRIRKPQLVEKKEDEKVEKVFVEKGFEKKKPEPSMHEETQGEDTDYIPVYVENPKETEYEKPKVLQVSETEPISEELFVEPESIIEEEHTSIDEKETAPVEPIKLETGDIESELQPDQEEPIIITPNETFYDPIPEPIEPDKSVIITENQTFYDTAPVEEPAEKPNLDESPTLEEPEPEPIGEISDAELPTEDPEPIPAETQPNVEEEPAPEPVVPIVEQKPKRDRRVRKPIIDESDPDLKIDLGTQTCPYCGSKVPDTIYCINCGKPLNPDRTIEPEEEN